MTKREARILALRMACALANGGLGGFVEDLPDDDVQKVEAALEGVAESLYKQAYKLGGEFNPNTGKPFEN